MPDILRRHLPVGNLYCGRNDNFKRRVGRHAHMRFSTALALSTRARPKLFRIWRRILATAWLQGHQPRVSIKTRDLTALTETVLVAAGIHPRPSDISVPLSIHPPQTLFSSSPTMTTRVSPLTRPRNPSSAQAPSPRIRQRLRRHHHSPAPGRNTC
jgi:hypothetical protein